MTAARADAALAGARPTASTDVFPSPRLYNNDLAPVSRNNRPWRAYHVFTLWANDVHSLGNYTFAIGLFLPLIDLIRLVS